MGSQDSVIKFDGQIGEIAMYRTKHGYTARKQMGIKGNRVLEDPRYKRTRETLAEFRRAGKAVKLFRTAFLSQILGVADGRSTSRLIKMFMNVVSTDPVNDRGQRTVANGNPELMIGFEFNQATPLTQSFRAPLEATIDRTTGSLVVSIPAFEGKYVAYPPGASHFQLTAIAAEIDFDAETFVSKTAQSAKLPVDSNQHDPIVLTLAIPDSGKPLFLTLGIRYVQVVNGKDYEFNSGAHNALKVVSADGVGFV